MICVRIIKKTGKIKYTLASDFDLHEDPNALNYIDANSFWLPRPKRCRS